MYLTAQRVRSPDGKREGINVFVYSNLRASGVDWRAPDLAAIADHEPGTLLVELIAVTPAMNAVSSYLDVVAPDSTRAAVLATQIEGAATRYPDSPLPATWGEGSVRLRFYASAAAHSDPPSEFRRLKDKLLALLGSGLETGQPRAGVTRAPNPLRVVSTTDAEGTRFFLDEESRRRLRIARPDIRPAASLGVTCENQAAIEQLYGSALAYSQFAVALTGLKLEQIDALAGVAFFDAEGRMIWRSVGVP